MWWGRHRHAHETLGSEAPARRRYNIVDSDAVGLVRDGSMDSSICNNSNYPMGWRIARVKTIAERTRNLVAIIFDAETAAECNAECPGR